VDRISWIISSSRQESRQRERGIASMTTKKARLSIALTSAVMQALAELARNEEKSLSAMARELIIEVLERHEDLRLSDLALKREFPSRGAFPHEKSWKE
jgi:predicted DNA-binding protein